MIYDLNKLQKKYEKYYTSGALYQDYIAQNNRFPLEFNLETIKESTIQKSYDEVVLGIQQLKKSGLTLLYKTYSFKSLGKQNLPQKIVFEKVDNYLPIINKESEYTIFVTTYKFIVSKYPQLKALFFNKPFLVLKYLDSWNEILNVVDYLLKNPNPRIYIRELCVKDVDTKFIEQHKKIIDLLVSSIKEKEPLRKMANFAFEKRYHLKFPQPMVRFRILDKALYIQNLSDITLTLGEFKSLNLACKTIYIVENKITTLSFPYKNNAIVIFGQGYSVSVLKDIEWFRDKEILYWGDIDLDGFAILSQLKGYYDNANSMLMDIETLEQFLPYKVEAQSKNREKELPHLNSGEKLVYERLVNAYYGENFRLEQEKIPLDILHFL